MVRKVCRGEGGLCPVDSETNRENFFSQPKEIRYFSAFSHSFYFSFPKNLELPSIRELLF